MRQLLRSFAKAQRMASLNSYDWALILPPVLGVCWSSLGLKLWRLHESDIQLRLWQLPFALRSEMLVCLAFLLLTVALRAARLAAPLRRLTLLLLQLAAAALTVGNILGHYFHEATSSGLSWLILAHGWKVFWDSPEVIQSEAPVGAWLQLALCLALVLIGPFVARLSFLHRPRCQERMTRNSLIAATLSACLGTAAIAGASAPVAWIADPSLNRDQGLALVLGAFEEPFAGPTTDGAAAFDAGPLRLERRSRTPLPNLVFVILESTRASAVTPYNPKLETTPFISDLASNSLFFEDANAVIPHTSKALVAIHCGLPPRPTMSIKEANRNGIPSRCLPRLLEDHGYQNVFFQSATKRFERRTQLVSNMGFKDFYPLETLDTKGFERANYFGYEDDVLLAKSEAWLKAHLERKTDGTKPFLATYLTLTPHHDYRAPKRYGRKRFHKKKRLNRYLNSVHYLDHFLKNLFEQYQRLGVYDSSVFVIVGDHGEAFGEHGRVQHDNVPYQEGIHVPLLIHDGRGQIPAQRIALPVSQIDLAPMLIELLGLKASGGSFPGLGLSQLTANRPIRFACWFEKQCVGMRSSSGKFIHHFGHRPDEFFDLATDPREQENRLESFPGDVEVVKRDLVQWLGAVDTAYRGKKSASAPDKKKKKKKKKPKRAKLKDPKGTKPSDHERSYNPAKAEP